MRITNKEKELFNQYFDEYCKKEYLETEQDESVHINFSQRFEANMDAVIKGNKSPISSFCNTAIKRVACIVAAFVVIVCGVTSSVTANPKPYLRLVEDESKKFSKLFCDSQFLKGKIEEKYIPSYIPNGYELSEVVSDDEQMYWVKYRNNNGGIISYKQNANFGSIKIDTEDAIVEFIDGGIYVEKIYINNIPIKCYYVVKNNYMFKVDFETTDLQKEELFKIIDSIVTDKIK